MLALKHRQCWPGFVIVFALALTNTSSLCAQNSQRIQSSERVHSETRAIDLGDRVLALTTYELDGYPVEGVRTTTIERNSRLLRREITPASVSPATLGQTPKSAVGEPRFDRVAEILSTALAPDSRGTVDPISRVLWIEDPVAGGLRLGRAYRVALRASDTRAYRERELILDADSGELIVDRVLTRYGSVTGTVMARLPLGGAPFGIGAPFTTVPLSGLEVMPVGAAPVYTASDGSFSIDATPGASVIVTAQPTSEHFGVFDQASGGSSYLGFLTPGVPASILFNASETEYSTAEVAAFHGTAATIDYLNSIIPDFEPTLAPISINVNLDGACFAFYSPIFQSINYSRAGSGCPNTAYGTTIAHEYFHHVQGSLPPTSLAYAEAMADVCAAYSLDTPIIGGGYYGPGTLLRALDTGATYPVVAGDPESIGLPLASAFWDLREALRAGEGTESGDAIASDLWLGSVLIGDGEVDSSIITDLLVLDDDDGDIGNGTPHATEILDAFVSHGFTAPIPPIAGLECEVLENQVLLGWQNPALVEYQTIRVYRGGSSIAVLPGTATGYLDVFPPAGPLSYTVEAAIGASTALGAVCDVDVAPYVAFLRGDVDGDGHLLINDAINMLTHLFLEQEAPIVASCPDRMDIDDDGSIGIGDAVSLLTFLFEDSAPPAPPYPVPAYDPTPDSMPCQ